MVVASACKLNLIYFVGDKKFSLGFLFTCLMQCCRFQAYYRQGVALQCLGRHADALGAFASALAQDDKSPQLLTSLTEAAMKSPLRGKDWCLFVFPVKVPIKYSACASRRLILISCIR